MHIEDFSELKNKSIFDVVFYSPVDLHVNTNIFEVGLVIDNHF